MNYKVVITSDAEDDLDKYVRYLLFVKKNEQADGNLIDDFEFTVRNLARVAGSLRDCENPRLQKQGYKRINFTSHRYFMLYRIVENMAVVDAIFHELQDYENKMY